MAHLFVQAVGQEPQNWEAQRPLAVHTIVQFRQEILQERKIRSHFPASTKLIIH